MSEALGQHCSALPYQPARSRPLGSLPLFFGRGLAWVVSEGAMLCCVEPPAVLGTSDTRPPSADLYSAPQPLTKLMRMVHMRVSW